MRIIISPAKRMRVATDSPRPLGVPLFLDEAKEILAWMQGLPYPEAKRLWEASDAIAQPAYDRLPHLDLEDPAELSPALLSYDGIAFTYMAPQVFSEEDFAYADSHLLILSGLYGVLRPYDGVVRYRLEMQAKAQVAGTRSLYEFWGDRIARVAAEGDGVVVNLASKEYSRCVARHLPPGARMVTCTFGELVGENVVQKGVYAKMARGDMVRFMAEEGIEDLDGLRAYDRMGYRFDEGRSSEGDLVFVREHAGA